MTDETRKMIVNVHAFSLLLMMLMALMKCPTVVRSINIILNVSMHVFVIVLSELIVKLCYFLNNGAVTWLCTSSGVCKCVLTCLLHQHLFAVFGVDLVAS